MTEHVLMNKQTGNFGIGVKIDYHDHTYYEKELTKLEGHSVILRSPDFDAWLIHEGNFYLHVHRKMVDEKCEVIGEL